MIIIYSERSRRVSLGLEYGTEGSILTLYSDARWYLVRLVSDAVLASVDCFVCFVL